jgi:hypothetical protein
LINLELKGMHMTRILIVLSLTLSSLFSIASAHASPSGETLRQVAADAQQKQALIRSLKARIARHAQMRGANEIVADIARSAHANRDRYYANGARDLTSLDKTIALGLDHLKGMSQDEIIALETAQLQSVMTSDNILFGVTRWAYSEDGLDFAAPCTDRFTGTGKTDAAWCAATLPLIAVGTVLTLAIDVVLLPLEFLGSALTGF